MRAPLSSPVEVSAPPFDVHGDDGFFPVSHYVARHTLHSIIATHWREPSPFRTVPPLPLNASLDVPRAPPTSPHRSPRALTRSTPVVTLYGCLDLPPSPRVSPRDRRLTLALQELQSSPKAFDTPHPAFVSPRRRLATTGSFKRSRPMFVSMPNLRGTTANSTRRTDLPSNEDVEPMLFVQADTYRVERGGEPVPDEPWQLGRERQRQAEHFLLHLPHTVHILRSRTHSRLVALECTASSPRALVASAHKLDFASAPAHLQARTDQLRDTQLLQLPSILDVDVEAGDRAMRAVYSRVFAGRTKVGVLYQPEGRNYEDELYSTCTPSAAFLRLLAHMSDEGSMSNGRYLAHWGTTAILLHVAPFIPMAERVIRHDSVVVVFKEGRDDVFVPTAKITHATQIYVVVEEVKGRYRVQVATKRPVPAFPPAVPTVALAPDELRDFLLGKAVCGSRAAHLNSLEQTRFLDDLIDDVLAQQ